MMEDRHLVVDGVRTHYLDRGTGAPIVLLHGAALGVDAWSTWHRTLPALARDFRVIAFDQIGFGRTDLPADGRYRNRLQRVDHALATLRALGVERASLIGHSEGGFMAARIAIVAPELAARLVIVTSGGTAPYLGGEADAEWMAASDRTYNDSAHLADEEAFVASSRLFSTIEDPERDAILRENYRRAMAVGQDKMFAALPASETDYREYGRLQEAHLFPYLPTLRLPVLLVWTTGDATVPVARGVKLQERFRRADLHVFSGAAHNVMHDRAPDFNRLLAAWCRG
jgi:pimeloyl-ACP methyl ester carboxylesterase